MRFLLRLGKHLWKAIAILSGDCMMRERYDKLSLSNLVKDNAADARSLSSLIPFDGLNTHGDSSIAF